MFKIMVAGGQPLLVAGKSVSDRKFDTAEQASEELRRLTAEPHLLSVRVRSIIITEVDE